MAKTIVQKVVFKNTSPDVLYNLYMDSKKHSESTGLPAKISNKEGGKFSAHDEYITGKNLQLVKDKLIVQSWRTSDWDDGDVDSTFIINLEPKGNDTVLHAIHANVPDKEAKDINDGWRTYYWEPWKNYLAGKHHPKPERM